MRRLLDRIYKLSGYIAAFFLFTIFAVVIIQVTLGLIDEILGVLIGKAYGLQISGYARFSGYFLAAATFFALAYTFKEGSHIRVSLVVQHLPQGLRRWVEVWCCGVATLLAGYFTLHMFSLVHDSYRFNDVSGGLVAVPLWIPQSAMVAGLVILTLALLDETLRVFLGKRPSYADAEGLLEQTSDETSGSTESTPSSTAR
ncbi:TRAP transporter small permease [Fodinicurvata sediminis]|uniref:TRAP transporter small permease n=1 Tax=Fodinicurvata sediminis TaxID=1121832 RepID=UPI0003B2F409|nr:TRAP transporter small permease subunit [Fodinicurvata sediminis]